MTDFLATANNAKSRVADADALDSTNASDTFDVEAGQGALFPAGNFAVTVWDDVTYPNDPSADANMRIGIVTTRSTDEMQTVVWVNAAGAPTVPATPLPGTPGVRAHILRQHFDEFAAAINVIEDDVVELSSSVATLETDVAALAPLASPTFTGTPAVPTAAPGTDTTQAASTGFVKAAVDASGGGGGGGGVLQVACAETASVVSGTTQIPPDNTIPQQTEGFEVLTCAITPQSASSTLYLDFEAWGTSTSSTADVLVALFKDSDANAIATSIARAPSTGGAFFRFGCRAKVASPGTGATTYKVRIGPDESSTVRVNGDGSGGTYFGGTMKASLRVTEVA